MIAILCTLGFLNRVLKEKTNNFSGYLEERDRYLAFEWYGHMHSKGVYRCPKKSKHKQLSHVLD